MSIQDTSKNETISFGGYEWIVLATEVDRVLLIASDVLEKRAYHHKYEVVTWETCSLRAFLNGEFYDRFSEEEKQRICETTIANRDNPEYKTFGGDDTTDYFFLLSLDEVKLYFRGDSERTATYKGSPRWWWLRTPGIKNHAVFVSRDGSANINGYRIDDPYSGVRPAFYLKTNF